MSRSDRPMRAAMPIAFLLASAMVAPVAAQPEAKVIDAPAFAALRSAMMADAAKSPNGSATHIFAQTPSYLGEFVVRVRTGLVEEHQLWTDEIVMREGEIDLVTGGVIEGRYPSGPAGEFRGTGLSGGVSRRLRPGDVVEIPAGVPRWMKVVPGVPTVNVTYKVR